MEHVNAHERQRTTKNVPLFTNISKSEMVAPQVPKYVFVVSTDLLGVAQAADEIWCYASFFTDRFKEGNVNPSRLNHKLFCIYLRIRK